MALPTKFQIKEYCPLVFRDLRERFDVSPEEFVVRHNPPFAPLAFLDSTRARAICSPTARAQFCPPWGALCDERGGGAGRLGHRALLARDRLN